MGPHGAPPSRPGTGRHGAGRATGVRGAASSAAPADTFIAHDRTRTHPAGPPPRRQGRARDGRWQRHRPRDGQGAAGRRGDRHDLRSHRGAVAAASEPLGGLHLAVASAGRGGLGPIIATPLEEWEDILATNLTGTFLLFKHAGAAIARSGGGSMVAISSIAAAVTHPFMGPYCVSKAGIDMLVRQTADELGRAGVRVNSVRPGIVATDLVSMIMDDEHVMASYLENMPISRSGEVGDVAAAVRYLLGPESSWVTGTSLSVDGGHHLRRGPDFEPAARLFFGDEAVDAAPRG